MATLNDILPPARIVQGETEFKTLIKEWPNGKSTAKRLWSTPVSEWQVEWDGIDLSEYTLLLNHFKSVAGRYGVFQFVDTHTGTTHNVRYNDDTLKRANAKPNVRGLYKISVKIREAK